MWVFRGMRYGESCSVYYISLDENHRDDTWHHYEVSRVGTTVTLTVDGVDVGTTECDGTIGNGSQFYIGSDGGHGSVLAIDEFYVADDTATDPPTEEGKHPFILV